MSTVDVDGFLELICSDPDLVRAEFDAIVAAGWPEDPRVPAARRPAPGPSRRVRRSVPTADPPAGSDAPGPDAWARQRSPPDPSTKDPITRR